MAHTKPVILWNSILPLGTLAADDTAAGYDVLNLKDFRTHTFWKGATAANKFITLSGLSPAQTVDAIGIVGHNLGTITADVIVQYWNGSTWLNLTLEVLPGWPYQPTDDKPILLLLNSQSATQFRFSLSSLSAAPQIAVVLLGTRLTMEQWLSGGWDPSGRRTVAEGMDSQTGNFLGATVRYQEIALAPQFERLTPTWVAANLMPFWDDHVSLLKPFFWAWEPSDHPTEVYWVRVADNQALSLPFDPDLRSFNLQLKGARDT